MSDETSNDNPKPVASPSATLVAQAEAVFESYLAARVVNARREVTAAKIRLLRDPRNRAKLDALRRAETDVEKLQAQLMEQKRNTARAKARTENAASEPTATTRNASHLTSVNRPDGETITVPAPPGTRTK